MNLANSCSREEISLEDVDRMSIEYRVLVAYAQRRWSASEYGQLLQRQAKGLEGSSLSSEDMKAARPASKEKTQGLSSEDQEQTSQKRSKKKTEKKKKSKWERLLFPSCLKAQTREKPRQIPSKRNGGVIRFEGGVGSKPLLTHEIKIGSKMPRISLEKGLNLQGLLVKEQEDTKEDGVDHLQDDLSITLVAERLAEIVENSRSVEGRGLKTFVRILSIEEDGPQSSKSIFEEDGKDNEEKVIDTIVALLRKSGDELQIKMQKDKAFSQCVSDLMSYAFFRRVTDQFLEEAPVSSTMDQIQRTKVAFAMEVAARLTAVDMHPMNIVLGFGARYLKENFSPWIHSQGGWEKVFGVPDQEEVE
ncbi:apoptosis facilitator Bcl-2-like protein 14 [Sceloporus undulatus]|uniref:apoptosis facilitator Bcl-2-like protein 14 n=1 Tax=Sceloporus undulatus TaxID=8520 RepID=UPI001C4C81C2|nr:apoptosis facilitator Bcl-2-like protein 14 [Sceloporus undulatus]